MAEDNDRQDDANGASSENSTSPAEGQGQETDTDTSAPLPEINFATFVFSLNQSALMNIGVIADPATGNRVKNLPLAKQTIDILGLLEEKTKGNLTSDEASMLKSILYDLRMIYVQHSK